jgi:hypothetical protein
MFMFFMKSLFKSMVQYYTGIKRNYVADLTEQCHLISSEILDIIRDQPTNTYLGNREQLRELTIPLDTMWSNRHELNDNGRIQIICIVIKNLNNFKKELLK